MSKQKRLTRSFFSRPTLEVARSLLGKVLVRQGRGARVSGRVVEVEAYVGEADTACHACRGRTPRNAPLYGPPGFAYVYFTYGMHWMLNAVTEAEGFPAAVLLRAVEPIDGIDLMRRRRPERLDRDLTSGPARLCAAFDIDRRLNEADLVSGEAVFFEHADEVSPHAILATPRIGVGYAAPRDRNVRWRFLLSGSPFVSRARAEPARMKPRVGSRTMGHRWNR
jgi:DNA-3-methyladenine glycosylase